MLFKCHCPTSTISCSTLTHIPRVSGYPGHPLPRDPPQQAEVARMWLHIHGHTRLLADSVLVFGWSGFTDPLQVPVFSAPGHCFPSCA